jgi:branched-chain amino acid transport system ATP-binding protein
MPDGLVVQELNAYYAGAHVVQDVSFEVGDDPAALIGRNGMGKSTVCNAIVGLVAATPHGRTTGSVRLDGVELVGQSVHRIAATGIGYVPQGRRIFPSLTTHEHLKMMARRKCRWTPERVYELFPRLAERRKVGGAQLSGGEQQMLAIGRALMTDPKLLIMDEPSEGLAPAVVEELVKSLERLESEGLRALLVEQNLGVAASLAQRLLIMVNGQLTTETTPEALENDADARQRYLGVTPSAEPAASPQASEQQEQLTPRRAVAGDE